MERDINVRSVQEDFRIQAVFEEEDLGPSMYTENGRRNRYFGMCV